MLLSAAKLLIHYTAPIHSPNSSPHLPAYIGDLDPRSTRPPTQQPCPIHQATCSSSFKSHIVALSRTCPWRYLIPVLLFSCRQRPLSHLTGPQTARTVRDRQPAVLFPGSGIYGLASLADSIYRFCWTDRVF